MSCADNRKHRADLGCYKAPISVRACVYSFMKHYLPSPHHFFSFAPISAQIFSLCQLWSSQQRVQPAKSGEKKEEEKNLEHDARRCQESLLRWHLDLHISFSWVTKYINTRFKLRSLASCSLPAHTLMQTHTHAYIHTALTIFYFFLDEFKKGEGDKTSSLWSMQLV